MLQSYGRFTDVSASRGDGATREVAQETRGLPSARLHALQPPGRLQQEAPHADALPSQRAAHALSLSAGWLHSPRLGSITVFRSVNALQWETREMELY